MFHQDGLSPGQSVTRVVSHHLSPWQSLTRVVSHQGSLSPGWSLTRAALHQGGLSPSLTRVVSHQGSLSPGWSLTRESTLLLLPKFSDSTCMEKNPVSQAIDVAFVKSSFVLLLCEHFPSHILVAEKNSNLKQKLTALC